MKKILDQLEYSARKLKHIWVDAIVSNFFDVRSPSMGVPTVRAVQVDNTLNPGTSIEYGRSYILTNVSDLHANFIVPANVADNDIVTWTGRFFTITMKAADATAKGLVVKTYVTSTDEDYVFDGSTWGIPVTALDTARDTTITGSWTFDIVNEGVQCLTTDDPTLAAATYLFGIAYDYSALPDYIYNYNMVGFGTVGSTGHYGYRHLNTGVAASVLRAGDTAAGEAVIAVSVNGVGDSQCNITGDLIHAAGVLKCTGGKTGTLAAPPADLIIGEVWADTTDSAVHPIYRISTVNT